MREKQTRVTTHHDKCNNEGMEQMAFEYKEESCSRCDPLQIKGLSVLRDAEMTKITQDYSQNLFFFFLNLIQGSGNPNKYLCL